MGFSRFFIDRPIFAGVIAVFIALVGAFCYPLLPLSQYPEIAPPTIYIGASFPGASAEVTAETVASPLEQEVNGVEGMLYMTSSSSNGSASIAITFRPGTDLDAAQVLVQNRVSRAEPRLPEEVRRIGISVNKQATGFLMMVALVADDPNIDFDYMSDIANGPIRDRLLRIPGVGTANPFGGSPYSMRIWIDPGKAAARDLTAGEIIAALRGQNVQVAAGDVGAPPFDADVANQTPIQVEGRLTDPEAFAQVVIKQSPDGSVVRVGDVARVSLGAEAYDIRAYIDGKRSVALGITQQPGANALSAAEAVLAATKEIQATLPAGVRVIVPYNPTEYVQHSVAEVQKSLLEAIGLVVLVVVVFLQTWRAAVIPILAIPVALVGAFAVQLALGYSINSLSLFALVLAVGIVVDDAIVVVESVERNIRAGLTPREAAIRTMNEVSGALIAIGLVMLAVFVPTAFVSGIPGVFYRQFAVVISTASVISLLISLTLSPALAARLLRPHRPDGADHGPRWLASLSMAGRRFNASFDWLSERYGALTARLVRMSAIVVLVYAGLLALTGWRLVDTPTGFIPEQDQGYLIGVVQLPPGASLERTDAVTQQASAMLLKEPGVKAVAAFPGLDGASFSTASNASTLFVRLQDWNQRPGLSADALAAQITQRLGSIEAASVFVLSPPAVQGLGRGGGFKMMVQNRGGGDYRALEAAANGVVEAASARPEVTGVFNQFNTASPRVTAKVDRDRALMLGVQPADIYDALGVYLGSSYVNDFNMLGRTYRVTAQAEPGSRDDVADVSGLKVRSASGAMAPLGSVATLQDDTGPARVVRHNLFPAAEIQGQAPPGVSSGQALQVMEDVAAKTLPPGFTYEWTDLSYQEKAAGNTGAVVFLLAVVFVFLVLAAQYEAFTLPLAVILIVPMCVLAAIVGVNLRGLDNNILTQVGLIVLVALAAKNAILIVEFARQAEERQGMDRFQAAVAAARTRLRPILMTSFAFIFGVAPLMLASGPGAEMRQALGTAVFSGMLGVTLFGLIFTPVFYVLCRWLARRLPKSPARERSYPTTGGGTAHDPLDDEAAESLR